MPYSRPTLTQLIQQIAADVTANIPGADGLLRFNNLAVISKAVAGMANLHYGYQDWISKQSNPFTATDEYLEAWAALVNIIRISATKASGTVTFTGVTGTDIPAGTTVVRSDNRTFTTNADIAIGGGGTATVAVTDATAGAAGNTSAGTQISLGTPIAGVQSNGVAATDFTGGADVESDTSLRDRMLQRYQNPPQGGSQSDYITWALEVAGVTRVWVNPNGQGAGTVVVYFMMDISEAAFGGFPQGTNGVAALETRDAAATGDQLAVANVIYPLQPVTALVYLVAPVAAPKNFTIAGLSPNNSTIKAGISAAITDTFLRLGAANAGSVPLASIEAAINAVPGILDFIITSPVADITTTMGQLPTLGTITYT